MTGALHIQHPLNQAPEALTTSGPSLLLNLGTAQALPPPFVPSGITHGKDSHTC